jgi:SOS response regulatory protein OraA/RecX
VARGYQKATAARTVDRCRELGYVGDARLAHDRARALRQRGAGSLKIVADLTARGLPEDLVESAVEDSLDGEHEIEWARRVLLRERLTKGPKAWRLLAGRGFPEEVVLDLLGNPTDD